MGHTAVMAMSGILPELPACEDAYKKVKKGLIRAAIYGFNDKRTSIVVKNEIAKSPDFSADWDVFMEQLPAKDVMYAVYDFEYYDTQSGYSDGESAPVKSKM